MKYNLYSVKDQLSEEYAPPFCAKNDNVAKRQYNDFLKNQKLNPNEFSLNFLGSMDTETGLIETLLPCTINGDMEVKE